jgi:hypothetical protein
MRAGAISCEVFRERAAPIKIRLLVQRSLANHEQLAQSRVQPRPNCAEDKGTRHDRSDRPKIETTLQQVANVLVLTTYRDERLILNCFRRG